MVKNLPTIERSTRLRFGRNCLEDQEENTIVFNASNVSFETPYPGGLYMSPVRYRPEYEDDAVVLLMYNKDTKEVTESGEAAYDIIATTLDGATLRGNTVTVDTVTLSNAYTSLITTTKAGIVNTAPEHTLSVGSNLFIHDEGSNVLTVIGNIGVSNDVTIDGNLRVNGTTAVIYTENTKIKDAIIELGTNNTSTDTTLDLGLLLNRPDSNVMLAFKESSGEFIFAYTHDTPNNVTLTPITDEDLDIRVYGSITTETNVNVTQNLNVTGNAYTNKDLIITGNVHALSNVDINENLNVTGNVNVASNISILKNLDIFSNVHAKKDIKITGNVYASTNVNVMEQLNVTGNTHLYQDLHVSGNTYNTGNFNITDQLNVTGDTNLYQDLYVSGNTYNTGNVNITRNVNITDQLNVTGNTHLYRDLHVSGNTYNTGNVNITNQLSVTGSVYLSKDIEIDGNTYIDGNVNAYKDLLLSGNAHVSGNVNIYKDLLLSGNTYIDGNVVAYKDLTLSGNAYIDGNVNAYKDLTLSGNAYVSGNVTITDQLSVTGNVYLSKDVEIDGNNYVSGNVVATRDISANKYYGDGGHLSNITLQVVTDKSNTTSNAVRFTNPHTAFVTDLTSNVEVKLDQLNNVTVTTPLESQYLIYQDTDEWINDYPSQTFVKIYNATAGTIYAGNAVYIIQQHNANLVEVGLADARDPDKMPCIGLVWETSIAPGGEGHATTFGKSQAFKTSQFLEGETLYVSNVYAGMLSNLKPYGVASGGDKIQNVGICSRVHASSGRVTVTGIGRSNDIPNANIVTSNATVNYVYVNTANNDMKKIDPMKLPTKFLTLRDVVNTGNVVSNVISVTGISITNGGHAIVAGNVQAGANVSIAGLGNKYLPYVSASKYLKDSAIRQETDGRIVINADLEIVGNILVEGNSFEVTSGQLVISDRIIDISNGAVTHDLDAGILIEHPGHNIGLIHHGTTDTFTMGYTQNGYSDTHILEDSNIFTLDVIGNVVVQNTITIESGDLIVAMGNTYAYGNVSVVGDLSVDTNIYTRSDLIVSGNTYISGNTSVTGNVSAYGMQLGMGGLQIGSLFSAGPGDVEGIGSVNITGVVEALAFRTAHDSGYNTGIANTAPTNTLSIGANAYINAHGTTILSITGNTVTTNLFATSHIALGTSSPTHALDIRGTANVGDLTATSLSVAADTDVTGTIGSAKVGYVGYGDAAGFAHYDFASAGNYAVLQNNTGITYINSVAGKSIKFREDNVDKMTLSDGNLGIGTTSPTSKLDVRGTISTGRNLAREVGTVIAWSSQLNTTRKATNVISGIKNFENGSSDWLTLSGQRVGAYVVVDLGQAYSVDRMVIYNQNELPDSKREVKGFTLQGSADNSTWTTVLTNECGRSNGHEPNPGWSFRIPANWDDDTEGTSYRYWKFIMNTFHGTDSYGGIMELELYEASNALDDEVSSSSIVAQDVYTETGNFNRGVAIGKGYGGTSTGENNLLVEGNVGIGTTSPLYKLDVHGTSNVGALTATTGSFSGDLTATSLSVAADTDVTGIIGRARVGFISGLGDYAAFAHYDKGSSGNYALLQSSLGETFINSSTGRSLYFRENNSNKMTLSDGNLGIGTTSPTYKLDVHGTSNVGALTATTATVPNDGDFVMGGKPLTSAAGLHWDRVNNRLGIGTISPATTLHVAGGTITNSGTNQTNKKTYSWNSTLANGTTIANATVKITFSNHSFYAKIIAQLSESPDEVSTMLLEVGGGNASGSAPTLAIAEGSLSIFGGTNTNPWSPVVTTTTTTVSIKPTTNMAAAGTYSIFIEYIAPNSSGAVTKITLGTTDVVTFGY